MESVHVLLLIAAALPALPQEGTGTIRGTVVNKSAANPGRARPPWC